jgi:hypothetical protein
LFTSRFLPCSECGASVERSEEREHRCTPERRAQFEMFAMREEVARVEERIREHLDTPLGRLEVWVAARDVRRDPAD